MPRADGNLRKGNIRNSTRRSRAASKPVRVELGRAAAQELQPRTQDKPPNVRRVHSGVAGRTLQKHKSESYRVGQVISLAIDLGALKKFFSNSVPSVETVSEDLAVLFAL